MGVGNVYIVGAGPGAHDLITIRGLRAIRRADVIVCDGLLPDSFLEYLGVSTGNTKIEVLGSGSSRLSQSEINQLICNAAKDGKNVVRLKGGDPLVFGRGNEEADFLTAHGIPWELIPGASAGTAAASAAGLPLTSHETARSFAVVTARCAGGTVNQTYPRADSLAVLMGVAVIAQVTAQLLSDGWPPDTPAALVERATLPWERRVYGSLCEISAVCAEAGIAAPAVLLVGTVAARNGLSQKRRRVLFTGLDPTNFRTLGDILHWPALHIVHNPEGYRTLPETITALHEGRFDWIVFTSKVGVDSFFRALDERALDARLLADGRISVAGRGTAARLREYGVRPDVVARKGGSRGILRAIEPIHSRNVLLVQGSHAPYDLEDAVGRQGGHTVRLALHKVAPHPDLGRPLPDHDVIYFVSPSGVRAYWNTYGSSAFRREIWCIGEVTQAELAKLNVRSEVIDPHVSANENAQEQTDRRIASAVPGNRSQP